MSYRYEDDYEEMPLRRSATRPAAGKAPVKRGASGTGTPAGARKSSAAPAPRGQSASARGASPKKGAPVRTARSRPAPDRAYRRDYDDYEERPVRKAAPRKKARKKRANPMLALFCWLIAIALAFGISYFVREYAFEIIRVSGDNMYETLMDGDLALVTKFDYKNEAPKRGDVVAVEMGGQKGVILRRVVGLPGETVQIVSGDTLVNGTKLLEQYIGLKSYDSFEGKTLPPGKYYILGDNRSETNDSRDESIALIDQEDMVGKVRWIVWPLNHLGSL